MDPKPRSRSPRRSRLPRTRGDGPWQHCARVAFVGAPPHPRGWTPFSLDPDLASSGSPAPAGMDLSLHSSLLRSSRLPRTRGDGPAAQSQEDAILQAPPHPRGWTLRHGGCAKGAGGSPAPAGMDLRTGRTESSLSGLPRTRGDGPAVTGALSAAGLAPPHPRGWTPTGGASIWQTSGSPAPAGMDPEGVSEALGRQRLPRTRGDGPPAMLAAAPAAGAPPHPRGWTSAPSGCDWRSDGSPAPAGMDPKPWRHSHRIVRLPRTRGDGPHP